MVNRLLCKVKRMLSPLRFEPIFKTNLWGGTRLRPLLNHPPSEEATGESWLLSDVDGSPSRVAHGPLAGRTLRELMADFGTDLLGDAKPINGRFPLLIKLIDARQELSVQVHPSDTQARLKDPTAAGKTEAWVVLAANPATSRIYSGFKTGMNPERFQRSLKDGTSATTLHQFTPEPGDCLFLSPGTVHAIGADLLIYEVQQTSDITYRLFDWNRLDGKTGQPRQLHVEDGLAVSNFDCGPCPPITPKRDGECERLVTCEYFQLERFSLRRPFQVKGGQCSILTVIEGRGTLNGEHLRTGDTFLIPASLTDASLVPDGSLTILHAVPGRWLC